MPGRSCPRSVGRWFGSHCSVQTSLALCTRVHIHVVSSPPTRQSQPQLPFLSTRVWLCVPAVHIHVVANPQKAIKPSPLTPNHKQQQPKSNNSLIDNLPSLCLEGLLTRRGAHRGGSTRTRLLFTVFNRHFSDPYRFIACRENPLLS